MFVAARGVGPLAWISRPGFHDLYKCFLFLCGDGRPLLLIYALSCVPAFSAAMEKFTTRRTDWVQWRYRFLFLWLIFPLFFIFILSQFRPLFLDRYFLFLLPALALLAAAGLGRLPSRWLTTLGLVLFACLSVRGVEIYSERDFDMAQEDWRSATRYVLDRAQEGDVLIFHAIMGRMPFEYYRWNSSGPLVICPHHGEQITFRDFYGHPDEAFLTSVPSRYPRVWIVFSHNQARLGGGSDALTERITQMFGTAYTQSQLQSLPGIEVRLYSGTRGVLGHGGLPVAASPNSGTAQTPR